MGIEFFGHKGFFHIVVDAEAITRLHIIGRRQCRSEDDDHRLVGLTDTFHHLETVHHRHVDVGNDYIGVRFLPSLHSFLTVGSGGHLITANYILQACLLDIGQRRIVFHQ